jgi:hypothetical protein
MSSKQILLNIARGLGVAQREIGPGTPTTKKASDREQWEKDRKKRKQSKRSKRRNRRR